MNNANQDTIVMAHVVAAVMKKLGHSHVAVTEDEILIASLNNNLAVWYDGKGSYHLGIGTAEQLDEAGMPTHLVPDVEKPDAIN